MIMTIGKMLVNDSHELGISALFGRSFWATRKGQPKMIPRVLFFFFRFGWVYSSMFLGWDASCTPLFFRYIYSYTFAVFLLSPFLFRFRLLQSRTLVRYSILTTHYRFTDPTFQPSTFCRTPLTKVYISCLSSGILPTATSTTPSPVCISIFLSFSP